MLDLFPVALTRVQHTVETEMRSALPGAPVVPERTRTTARQRTSRSRAALATRLARFADFVAPRGAAPAHRTASSR